MKNNKVEKEITEDSFESILDQELEAGSEREDAILYKGRAAEKCFQLAQSYHKQQLSKALTDAANELPTDRDIQRFRINSKRMREKASQVIAKLKIENDDL